MHAFVVHVEDRPGVLNRVVSLFRRRAYNIHDITSSRSHEDGVHRMTIWVDDAVDATRIAANLHKVVDVISVDEISQEPRVTQGLALVKVNAPEDRRPEVLAVCATFEAQVLDTGPDALVTQIVGDGPTIESFVDQLRPFGLQELAQTGVVTMTRCTPSTPSSRESQDD